MSILSNTIYRMDHNVNISELTDRLLGALDARSRDVVIRRFGLGKEERETLESIGKEYGITRERVRQIEAHTKKTLAGLREQVRGVIDLFQQVFETHGGVMAESHVVETLRANANVVRFYLHMLPEYDYVTENELFQPHWRHAKLARPEIDKIVKAAREILVKKQVPIEETEFIELLRTRVGGMTKAPVAFVVAALTASRDVKRTVFQTWGLSAWAEVSPRGVGDKAFAVLRRANKPAHFREIAAMINDARFDHKQANPQTVHNELIKDERFVLVGRGLYGLREWGYIPGTVADVLETILKKSSHPLTRDELVDEVLKQRIVKKNTILLGLQNSKRFQKTAENRYTLR